MKKYISFNESKNHFYYNSHGTTMSLSEFYEIEIKERKNYTKEEFNQWLEKYDILPIYIKDSECIWVVKNIRDVYQYILPASYYKKLKTAKTKKDIEKLFIEEFGDDGLYTMNDYFTYSSNEGVLIEESNDGDGGFLFILN